MPKPKSPKSSQKPSPTPAPTLKLSVSRDIPLDRLFLSQSNVRQIKAGVSIEDLAEDIARRTLLQSLTVRPIRDESGAETGTYEIPAGGRRFRALKRLVEQGRLAHDALVPCVIREGGVAEEDSLAENVQRAALHPLDQFRAFQILREKGESEDAIAAAFFVTPAVVRQRLKLASVAPALLDLYAEDAMTLAQLTAFAVSDDHQRQIKVWEATRQGWNREPYHIRRLLTEGAVRAGDKRARFIGLPAYEAAGGGVLRDLFSEAGDSWLEDAALLDRLVTARLEEAAATVGSEGWAWVEAAVAFPYGYTFDLRRIAGVPSPLSDDEAKAYEALKTEVSEFEAQHEGADELPDEVDARLGEIEAAIEAIENRPMRYAPEEIAGAGVFISLDGDGALRIERGFVRPQDEAMSASNDPAAEGDDDADAAVRNAGSQSADDPASDADDDADGDANDDSPALSDRLMIELTEWRTLALRDALASRPDVAFVAALHRLCLVRFYRSAEASCLELDARTTLLRSGAPGLAECAAAVAIEERRARFAAMLPTDPGLLWSALMAMTEEARAALFAQCVAESVDAVFKPYARRNASISPADALASALDLDVAAAGWRPTAEAYFARISKAAILAAVAEAKGEDAAARLASLKKPDMAAAAEAMLRDTGWLPIPLRTLAATNAMMNEPETDRRAVESAAEERDDGRDDVAAAVARIAAE